MTNFFLKLKTLKAYCSLSIVILSCTSSSLLPICIKPFSENFHKPDHFEFENTFLEQEMSEIRKTEIEYKKKSILSVQIDNSLAPESDLGNAILEQLEQRLEELNVCLKNADFYIGRHYPQIYSISEQRHIIELRCSFGKGSFYEYFLYQEEAGDLTLIPLDFDYYFYNHSTSSIERKKVRGRGIHRIFNSNGNTLTFFDQYIQGVFICGVFSKYQWNNVELSFNLIEYRDQPDCISNIERLLPEEFPLIYKAVPRQ